MEFIGTPVITPSAPIFADGFSGLASFVLRLMTIVAGLFAVWNFVAAGYKFMMAGENAEAIGEAWGAIWKSLIGMLIIVSSFVFAAFIGWVFLDSPTAIIAPDFNVTPYPTSAPASTNTPTSTPTSPTPTPTIIQINTPVPSGGLL